MSAAIPYQERIHSCIVEIATPFSTGTGFYLKSYNVIVTNEHVIRDNREVIVKGESFEKQVSCVLLLDEWSDLALLSPPDHHIMPEIEWRIEPEISEGEAIIAMGHPYGLKFSITEGIVSSLDQKDHGMEYIMHDAALNPGNSGGPLIDSKGLLLGINSFVIKDGENLGFAIPMHHVLDTLQGLPLVKDSSGCRCMSCRKFVYDDKKVQKYCEHCGAEILLPSQINPYTPIGVSKILEDIITDLGYDVRLTREGRHHWNIPRGSALVRLSYHRTTGLIDGDAYLCRIPDEDVDAVYEFLLRENQNSKGLVFSVKGQFILLSLLIYDRHLDEETGKIMLKQLFELADHYDDVLVDRFGASWIEQS